LERQGQGQVVTCSGAFKDGSLRVIRNGIGINEQAAIEMPGVKGIWSLRFQGSFDDCLVVTFVGETRFLKINGEELEEAELPGFDASSQTLYCGNATDGHIVQVTNKSVRLINIDSFEKVSEWGPSDGSQVSHFTDYLSLSF
jgi:DNA damage-binding protein 1